VLTSMFPITHLRYTSLPVVGSVLDKLCEWLQDEGFPPDAIRRRILAAPFLDQLLRSQGVKSLTECTASQLKASLLREERWTPHIAHSLGLSLLDYLQQHGQVASMPPTPSEQVVGIYCGYLQRLRGLGSASILRHAAIVGDFLCFLKYDDRSQGLKDLRAAEIDAFVADTGPPLGRITLQKVAAILRSFLKFLAARGEVPPGPDVLSPRHYRGERIVRALPWDTVLSLLRAVDRSTIKGRRDYAMLLLIATYGLRVAEVASLDLDDIEWRARVIRVPRPKIGTPLVVPLTDKVATAVVDYLRHRRPTTHSQLFLRVRAPQGPIKSTAVYDAFDVWAARAGLCFPALGGPHCVRHYAGSRTISDEVRPTTRTPYY